MVVEGAEFVVGDDDCGEPGDVRDVGDARGEAMVFLCEDGGVFWGGVCFEFQICGDECEYGDFPGDAELVGVWVWGVGEMRDGGVYRRGVATGDCGEVEVADGGMEFEEGREDDQGAVDFVGVDRNEVAESVVLRVDVCIAQRRHFTKCD